MTIALTKVTAYGVEVSEPLQKQFYQHLVLEGTGANTDVDYDFGDAVAGSLGTFWTAVGSTEPGITALSAIRDINVAANIFESLTGLQLSYVQADSSVPVVQALTSSVYAGGSATPTLTVTGLLTTDTILGATQIAKNANNLPLIGAASTCAVNDQYAVVYSADPGGTGTVRVMFSRATTTVAAGTYQLSAGALTKVPNLLFLSGDAPTSWKLDLCWQLKPGINPIECEASA